MKVSLAITTYNRDQLTVDSFKGIHNDDRISEVVIVDDASEDSCYYSLDGLVKNYSKVHLYRNEKNLGMMQNKMRAVQLCTSEWVILFDSDNVIGRSYIDAIPRDGLSRDVIYCPSFARPMFDYRAFAGRLVDSVSVKKMIQDRMGNACMNTCNYLVHRETYLSVFQNDPSVKATDTIAFNYLWLKALKKFYIVPGMEYDHLVHSGSGFMADADYNMMKSEFYRKKIMSL